MFFMAIILLTAACAEDDGERAPDLSQVPEVEIGIERLEKKLIASASPERLIQFLDENPTFSEQYFKRSRYPEDSVLVKAIMAFAEDAYTDTLLQDVDKVFADLSTLEASFEQAFRHVKYYYPEFEVPKVYTMVSGFGAFGFGQDLLITDSILVVGLDYFTGPEGRYMPPQTPAYILRRYKPEYIVPNALKFISTKYNSYDYEDESLLAEMIFYGKALEFADKMMPSAPDTLIMGYTQEEMGMAEQFQDVIWASFVERNLFYEKQGMEKSRYVGERPKVVEIADKCPGRIGRWLGWRILEAYLRNNPEKTFQEMMANPSAQELFQKSKFRPAS